MLDGFKKIKKALFKVPFWLLIMTSNYEKYLFNKPSKPLP